MIEKDDWRLSWHQDHLKGRTLRRIPYVRRSDTNDHEHCEFCWSKFSEYEGKKVDVFKSTSTFL